MSGAKTFNQAINKSGQTARRFAVLKSDGDKRLVFGWASVAVRVTGEVIEDFQEDVIDIRNQHPPPFGTFNTISAACP
ncbi:MAG: hypothetical protein LBS19_04545 [Clostridiales bacterium]|jgi:hypothetical protein|nr:hypothetical protein [Clostridiales bacterium]